MPLIRPLGFCFCQPSEKIKYHCFSKSDEIYSVWERMKSVGFRKAVMDMNVKKVWMSSDSGGKNRYGLHTLGGILGIAALTMLLSWGGVVLLVRLDVYRELYLAALCCAVTVFALTLAARLGRRSVQDATVFFLTEDDRLFAMDARRLVDCGKNPLDRAAWAVKTQNFLREIARKPFVPAGADEILQVKRISENSGYRAIVCSVRHPNSQTIQRTYFVVKGLEDEEGLLRQMERRTGWRDALEQSESRRPTYMLLSALFFAGFTVLCVLSHPALSILPQSIYFPCLGAAFIAVFFLVWFIVRQRRGE